MSFTVTRRGLLIGAAAGGGLLVAFALGRHHSSPPLEPGRDEVAFDAWIKIASDGVVTVAVPQLEMGQGVTTILPQVVAFELGADWRQIAVEPAPVSGAYANLPLAAEWAPLWMPLASGLADEADDVLVRRFAEAQRFIATADGTSLAAFELPCREAAASARAMLAMAAADRWDVAWEECEAANGFILHEKKRLSFAELARAAAEQSPPDPPPLRTETAAELPSDMGSEAEIAYPRLDLPAKVDGSYLFAGDVRLPGMVFAAIRHGPLDEAELTRFDASAAKGLRGLVGVVKGKRWLAAVGESWWIAEQALARMAPRFRVERPVSSIAIEQALDTALRHADAERIAETGDVDGAMPKPTMAARYDVAPALHATLETASATARLRDGKLELWLAAQAPEQARRAVAEALDLSEREVILYPMAAGGSFDRRLEHDHAIEVALIAREIGRPVQLIWSRWQEHLAGRPRTPVAALLTARALPDGTITAWRSRIACPPTAREFGERLFGNRTSWSAIDAVEGEGDAMALAGGFPPYAIGNVVLEHVPVTLRLPTARMRGNAHGYTAFFTESFIDELATRHRREPLSYRMQMLGGDLRLAQCLQHAARLADWGGGVEQSGQGLACHRIGEGRIAAIATANRTESGVRVSKIDVAVDIGRIVNLDIARQQIEGGLLFGLGLALGCSADYARGVPSPARYGELGLPALADVPEIGVEFIRSDAQPIDPGELGVAVVAPAVANALFSATGLRFRRLPLLSGMI